MVDIEVMSEIPWIVVFRPSGWFDRHEADVHKSRLEVDQLEIFPPESKKMLFWIKKKQKSVLTPILSVRVST